MSGDAINSVVRHACHKTAWVLPLPKPSMAKRKENVLEISLFF